MKEIREYFSHVKEQYKQFGLSTYFAVKSLEVNASDNSAIAKGVLTTKFSDHGIDVKETSYFLSYDLVGSTLRLKEFHHIESVNFSYLIFRYLFKFRNAGICKSTRHIR